METGPGSPRGEQESPGTGWARTDGRVSGDMPGRSRTRAASGDTSQQPNQPRGHEEAPRGLAQASREAPGEAGPRERPPPRLAGGRRGRARHVAGGAAPR